VEDEEEETVQWTVMGVVSCIPIINWTVGAHMSCQSQRALADLWLQEPRNTLYAVPRMSS